MLIECPVQPCPREDGAGLLQCRDRYDRPRLLQVDQLDQLLQPPLTINIAYGCDYILLTESVLEWFYSNSLCN